MESDPALGGEMTTDFAVLLFEAHEQTLEVIASVFQVVLPTIALHTAKDATSAVSLAMENKIDLIIWATGLRNYQEMFFAMQLCDRLLHIPIFLIADDAPTWRKIQAEDLPPQVKEVFYKPIDLDDLLLKVRNLAQHPAAA